jgi:type II restriction enzyme
MTEYPFDEKPLQLEDPERLKIDVVKQIYNFYPQILLEEIGEKKDDLKYGLLNLAKLIEQYSNNNEGVEAYLFEDILTDGFNMFVNVEAKKIGGAGNADLECLYITKKKKFAVDAKSTKNKLSGLNAGRLAEHRTKIGGEYTIVVTPRYVPAVLHDIKSAPIVIIRASTFSEYLYNHIDNEVREIDYADFDNIIVNNLGKDISRNISTLTIDKFSVKN